MKGTFRIGGAVLMGVVIILGAFWVRGRDSSAESGTVIVAPAPERSAITTHDSDGDGVEDWEEALSAYAFETIAVSSSTALRDGAGAYEEPTTLTGRFSEAFLQDYLEGKMRGADFSNPDALVGSAVSAIESSARSRRYTRLDIVRIETDVQTATRYGNDLATIMGRHSIQNENELIILERAISADDPALLGALAPIRDVYEKIVRDALTTPVPEAFADEHIAFLNASEAIRMDVSAMELAFTDPLFALARVRGYQEDAKALYESLKGIAAELDRAGVSYRNDEPGAVFYLFGT